MSYCQDCATAHAAIAARDAEIDRLTAQVREAEWQPIETAPKDGTDVLLLQHGKAIQAHWGGGHHKTWVSAVGLTLMFLDNASHWQPLPPPPAREGSE